MYREQENDRAAARERMRHGDKLPGCTQHRRLDTETIHMLSSEDHAARMAIYNQGVTL